MAKSTFRRVAKADPANMALFLNFFIAGWTFIIGSVFFWPGLPNIHLCETIGAALFTIGSLMYMFGAISDFRHIKKELREGVHAVGAGERTPRWASKNPLENREKTDDADESVELATISANDENPSTRSRGLTFSSFNDDAPPMLSDDVGHLTKVSRENLKTLSIGERHIVLYKRFIIKCQKLNGLIYAVGGFIFAIGSILFFPQMDFIPQRVFHGCWCFISGTCVYLTGAYLGVITAKELAITAKVRRILPPEITKTRHMWWWSDEDITIVSCYGYIVGALCFLVGTGFFFPGMSHESYMFGAFMFIVGSIFFTGGAAMDYLRFERTLLMDLHQSESIAANDEDDLQMPDEEHAGM